jgi:hypothetical protein
VRVKSAGEWRSETPLLVEALREFGPRLQSQPFENRQGLRGVSAFALYWYLRRLSPTLIFEVGVWRGYGTWIIEQAAPEAEIVCLDPIFPLEHLLKARWRRKRYRSPRATYSSHDFSCLPIAELSAGHERPVVFFDDHQNKLPRLLQARAAGIRDVIFDDNTREVQTHETLEAALRDEGSAAALDRLLESYETFPALWPVDARIGSQQVKEDGLGLPVEDAFAKVHADRELHSYMTYVRLRPPGPPSPSVRFGE